MKGEMDMKTLKKLIDATVIGFGITFIYYAIAKAFQKFVCEDLFGIKDLMYFPDFSEEKEIREEKKKVHTKAFWTYFAGTVFIGATLGFIAKAIMKVLHP